MLPTGNGGPMTVTVDRPGRVHRQALIVSVASLGSNASSYVFTVVAARLLVPASFGELSALMAVLVMSQSCSPVVSR
ncbi:hypothetical protein GCM10009557_84370 [Virgisporangium ochraceum]